MLECPCGTRGCFNILPDLSCWDVLVVREDVSRYILIYVMLEMFLWSMRTFFSISNQDIDFPMKKKIVKGRS